MLTIPSASKATTPAAAAAPNALAAVVDARRADLRSAGQATVHAFANALSSLAQSGASSEIKTKAMVAIKQVRNKFVCLCQLLGCAFRALFSHVFNSPFSLINIVIKFFSLLLFLSLPFLLNRAPSSSLARWPSTTRSSCRPSCTVSRRLICG